jgi:hypothetical protein
MSRGGLSPFLQKGFKGHQHEWKLKEQRNQICLIKYRVCELCSPIRQDAYDFIRDTPLEKDNK